MKRLSLAVAASMLLAPASAFAAYATPGELFAAIQDTTVPRSFSVTAHAASQGTYVSVWANGSEQGADPLTMSMTSKVTVDVVKSDFRMRAKAELMAVNGTLYIRVNSVDGSYKNAFAVVSGMFKQQQWLSLPLSEGFLNDVTGGTPMQISSANPDDADSMFHMQSAPGKNGTTVYTLSLTQDYAVALAQTIRGMLKDESTVSQDFFPWRELAEGIRFESSVVTDGQGRFLSSVFSLHTASTTSSLSVSGSEKRLASSLVLKAPANAVSAEEALMSFSELDEGSLMPVVPTMEEPTVPESISIPGTSEEGFNAVEEETTSAPVDCNDPTLSDSSLSILQRTGACPVTKKSTRYGGW